MLICVNFKPWSTAFDPLDIPKLNLVMPLSVSSKQFSYNFLSWFIHIYQDGSYGKHGSMFPISVSRKRLNLKLVDLRAVIARNNSYPLLSTFFVPSAVLCKL